MSRFGLVLAGALLAAGGLVAIGATAGAAPATPTAGLHVKLKEPSVTVWVGALCNGVEMRVATSRAALEEAGCHDAWSQVVTEGQVRGFK